MFLNLVRFFILSETHPNVSRGSEEYSAEVAVKDHALLLLDSLWFLVSAKNQLRTLYYGTWYIFNFGYIFRFFETHPNVSRGSEEYSTKEKSDQN